MLLDEVQVVGVASEYSLVIHDVKGVSVFVFAFFEDDAAGLFELLLVTNNFGLCALERLRHILFI